MSVPGHVTVLSVQKISGGWAKVMSFHGGDSGSQLGRAVEHANSLVEINNMPVRIVLEWEEEMG
ncbi:hypothetical protein GCM10009748_23540 [Agromyces lapidis]